MSVVDRTSSEFKALVELYDRAPLRELGQLADAERWRQHPDPMVTYIIDRNINYTNVCVADCQFCAFFRRPKHGEGYVLSFEQIGAKIDECKAIGGVQILPSSLILRSKAARVPASLGPAAASEVSATSRLLLSVTTSLLRMAAVCVIRAPPDARNLLRS